MTWSVRSLLGSLVATGSSACTSAHAFSGWHHGQQRVHTRDSDSLVDIPLLRGDLHGKRPPHHTCADIRHIASRRLSMDARFVRIRVWRACARFVESQPAVMDGSCAAMRAIAISKVSSSR